MDMAGVGSIMSFIAVLRNPRLVETNALPNSAFTTANCFGIETAEQFLFALGVLVFVLLVVSLAFQALTTNTQVRFTLIRENAIGERRAEGYLHQRYR